MAARCPFNHQYLTSLNILTDKCESLAQAKSYEIYAKDSSCLHFAPSIVFEQEQFKIPSTDFPISRNQTATMAPVYFFREHEEPYGFLSQWYEARFMVLSQTPGAPSMVFLTTEQYMMYQKAILFGDTEVAEKIMAAKTPKKQKALGRQVKGFDEEVWKDNRERIVEEANWHKFSHPARKSDLKKRLLETEKRELVEVRGLVNHCAF